MRSFRLAPIFALLCAATFSLTGCGGSDNDTASPTSSPSPSGSPGASRNSFAGQYRGSWLVETEPDAEVFERITITGPARITVSDDGGFTAVLENTTEYTYGVFTGESKTHTLRGTVQESGFFTADVTIRETVGEDVVETTDTITGYLAMPVDNGDRYSGPITLRHGRVQISGNVEVFKN